MQPLVDFLNHGFLPFVGRSAEIDRLVGFWRSTIDAHALRATLLSGEAGVGKSRFIEELLPRIADAGGAVAHLKFYPESNSPVAALIAEALWRSVGVRSVLRREPAPTLPTVVEALRRMARLRATLLVIEDIHLLGGDTLREFSTLLAAIADEPLSILCTARPVELDARGVIEPYLIEEIELKGLEAGELEGMWRSLFGYDIDEDVQRLLVRATRGNALALKSALRGAVSAGALVQDPDTGVWTVSAAALAPLLERNLELLVAGMAAHLTPAERDAAGTLAALGEVFARETATAMLNDSESMIGALLFKGILVTSSTPSTPLSGEGSQRPLLSFTHTLVHRYFVAHRPTDPLRLVSAIASGLPLYSVLPFDIIAQRPPNLRSLPVAEIRRALARALKVNKELDNSSAWELGIHCWRAAASLLIAEVGRWERHDWFTLLAEILYQRLVSLRRSAPQSWEPLVALYLRLTDDLSTPARREERCYALRFLYRLRWERDGLHSPELVEEVRALVRLYPALRFGHGYIYFLGYHLTVAVERDDVPEQRRIEREVEEMVASEAASEQLRNGARTMLGRSLINLFETPAELASRLALLDELLRVNRDDLILAYQKLCLLFQTGEMRSVIAESRELIPRTEKQGLERVYWHSRMQRLCAEIAMGGSLADRAAEARTLLEGGRHPFADKSRGHLAHQFLNTALLQGENAEALALAGDYLLDQQLIYPQRILLALARHDDAMLDEPPFEIYATYPELTLFVDYLFERTAVGEADLLEAARGLLSQPTIRILSILMLHALLALFDAIQERRGVAIASRLEAEIASAMEGAMGWLFERRLAGWMRGLFDRHVAHMRERSRKRWRDALESLLAENRCADEKGLVGARMKLSMLGTIAVDDAAGRHDVRGSRLRALLGLMVANHMQRRPLEREEFWMLAGGVAEDATRSRKTMHQGVLRLRELLGRDAVLTDTDVPRLNLDIIGVDLLDAQRLLDEALDAMHAGGLVRARTALTAALDLVHGEIPFPALYDEFFEAAREEFENTLRRGVIEVGGRLLREGDASSAEGILERGLASIPEDEDLGQLLRTALEQQGKHVEAARVRLRMAMAE
jgi:DNA-binding SARP family transcriptional activator